MHGLSVRWDNCHAMSFDSNLSRAHGRKCIDQSESVPSSWSDGENFEWCVCHESGIRVTELSSSVNQHWLRILPGIDGESTGVSFSSVLVQPITDQHNVRCQIEVVQMWVGIAGRWLTHNNTTVKAIDFLEAGMCMPEMCTRIASPLISICTKRRCYILQEEYIVNNIAQTHVIIFFFLLIICNNNRYLWVLCK